MSLYPARRTIMYTPRQPRIGWIRFYRCAAMLLLPETNYYLHYILITRMRVSESEMITDSVDECEKNVIGVNKWRFLKLPVQCPLIVLSPNSYPLDLCVCVYVVKDFERVE